jgi:putative ABC transport system substrate-binding protein
MRSPHLAGALALILGAMSLTACSSGSASTETTPPAEAPASSEAAATSEAPAAEEFTIGVAVYVDHPSLQLVRDNFEQYLEDKGVKVTYKDANAQADGANVATIATTFATDPDLDLILAITTPIAQGMVEQEKEVPIIYAAITDPADAGLVPAIEGPSGTNVVGTSDLNPNAKPVGVVHDFVPEAKVIGTIYSSSEANSIVQIEAFRAEAAELGLELREVAITNTNEIATAVETLADVDAILVPADNTLVAGLGPVITFGETHQIPVFTADAESVSKGAIASNGLSYATQGLEAGEMAYQILVEGKKPGDIACVVTQQTQLYVNPDAAAAMGLTIPESLLVNATIVTTTG